MEEFIERVARARIGETFNFYRDGRGAATRRQRLRAYLESRREAPLLLVGEAAGYRGARVSGIPFTSERQLTGRGPAEATATIVRRVLAELGLEAQTLCWNVVPTHPHLPGRPETNRRPTRAEVDGRAALAGGTGGGPSGDRGGAPGAGGSRRRRTSATRAAAARPNSVAGC